MFLIIWESLGLFWTAESNADLNMCTHVQRCRPGQQWRVWKKCCQQSTVFAIKSIRRHCVNIYTSNTPLSRAVAYPCLRHTIVSKHRIFDTKWLWHVPYNGGSKGCNRCKCTPSKNRKKWVFSHFEGFWPITMFPCVSYYWEHPIHLYKVNMIFQNPLTIRSLYKNTPLHHLWHF